jgi:hypothetical protein
MDNRTRTIQTRSNPPILGTEQLGSGPARGGTPHSEAEKKHRPSRVLRTPGVTSIVLLVRSFSKTWFVPLTYGRQRKSEPVPISPMSRKKSLVNPAITLTPLWSIHTRRASDGSEQPSIRPEPSRSQPEVGSARPRSVCRYGAIRWILCSAYHRNARKQSECGVPSNVIVSVAGDPPTTLAFLTPIRFHIGQPVLHVGKHTAKP